MDGAGADDTCLDGVGADDTCLDGVGAGDSLEKDEDADTADWFASPVGSIRNYIRWRMKISYS